MAEKVKKARQRWQTCNVLDLTGGTRRLWQFNAGGDKFGLAREETRSGNEPLTVALVKKEWHDLLQPRMNVAWLPAGQVFLRAVQLPRSEDFAETIAMVELQLEKISPLPVAQCVWTFELLPQTFGDMQTAVVLVVARHVVEEFLGQLEGQGYLADRLELAFLDQLRSMKIEGNGVWLFPGVGGNENACLAAWWYSGTLWNLTLMHLPPDETRAAAFKQQLAQITWAGELEGWLNAPPKYHLIADPDLAGGWEKILREQIDAPVEVSAPLPAAQTAALSARRAVHGDPRINLLPPEYAARYRQQFVDKLWMRSLGALLLLYVFGTIIYFGIAQVYNYKYDNVRGQLARAGVDYTNTIKIKEQAMVLHEQMALQFAALDSYRAAAALLPDGLLLDQLNFMNGKKVSFSGSAEQTDSDKVNEFFGKMRKAKNGEQDLFTNIDGPVVRVKPGTSQINWSFTCDLKRPEFE